MNVDADSPIDQPRIEAAVREILAAIGEDPERDGTIAEVLVKAGDAIDAKDLLIVFAV